ncbi:unnamed protein product, partial [Closterium sp. NIES-65]
PYFPSSLPFPPSYFRIQPKVYTPCFCSLGCAVPNLPPPFAAAPDRLSLPQPTFAPPVPAPVPSNTLPPPVSPFSNTLHISSPLGLAHPQLSPFIDSPIPSITCFPAPHPILHLPHSLLSVPSLPSHVLNPPPPNLLITRYQAHANSTTHYPLPLPLCFPTLPSPLGSTCPPPPPVEFCPALPTSGPPPVPTPCSPPPLITPALPPPLQPANTSPLNRPPSPPPPWAPIPSNCQPPLTLSSTHCAPLSPPFSPFPKLTPPHPGLCQGVPSPFDALLSQLQQLTPPPARHAASVTMPQHPASGGKADPGAPRRSGRARGELAADTAREGVSEFVCEGAAEAAEDGAAKAAREGGQWGVVGEGAAEAAEERAAEAAREGAAAAARERAAGAAREGSAGTVTLARQRAEAMETAGATEATVGGGMGGGATGAAGKGVTGTGTRESAAPAVAREGTAGARVGEGTAVASKAKGEAAAEAAGRAIARPVGAAGAAANAGKHTAGPAGPAETAKGASSKAAAGGVGSGDIGGNREERGVGVPTGVGTEKGDVIAIEEDEGEDVMHIDGPLAQYLTLDGEGRPAPLQPHVEVPPLPPMPVPMLAEGPMEGLGETLRTEPARGSPHPHLPSSSHPPPGAPLPHPHPQVPVVSRGAAKALAFLAEPCSPTPTLLHGQPPSPSPTPDPRLQAVHRESTRAAETHPQGLAPQAHGSGGTRVEGPTGEATTEPTPISLPPPFVPRSNLHTGPAPRPPPPTPSPGRVPHEWPRWAAITPHTQLARSVPTEGDVSRREEMHTEHPPPGEPPILPPPTPLAPQPPLPSQTGADDQVATAAIATGREAVGLRDAPMADATDSPSHPSHPFHVDDPLPQPMAGLRDPRGGEGWHFRFAGDTPPEQLSGCPTLPVPQDQTRTYAEVTPVCPFFIPPATQPGASLPTPMETDRVLRPCHSHLDGVAPPPVQPVAQEVTSSRDEASAPTETPPPGVAEPSLEPHPAEGQEHTTAHTSGSPPRPPSPASTPVPARGPALSLCDTTSIFADTPPRAGLVSRLLPSSQAILSELRPPTGSPLQPFTDAQWQTLDSVDWTEYFSPERIHTRPLRRVPERVRGGYLDVLSAILVCIAQDPEAAGPTFLLAAAPTLFLVPATPPNRSHTAAIATRISRFGRGEWAELVSDALGRRTPLPQRTGHRSRTATDPSAADERRIARCLRLAACNETSRACAALESAEAAPDTQGTIQRLQSKHPNAERPTPAWLSGFQGSPLVLSVDHLPPRDFHSPAGLFGRTVRMFQALQASPEFQCLIPFIGLFYGTPSDLHYRSGTGVVTMHSERGTRQGDPLSPFLYALTQRLALEPVLAEGDVQLWSYADDTYVLGPPDRVLQPLCRDRVPVGNRFVRGAESPGSSREDGAGATLASEVAPAPDSCPPSFGVCQHSSAVPVEDRPSFARSDLQFYTVGRTPGRDFSAAFSFRDLGLSRGRPRGRPRPDLPPHPSRGFGIRRMARIAPVSFVCSWVQCAPILCSLPACGEVFRQSFALGEPEQIDRALQTALEGLPPDVLSLLPPWPSCASASPDSLFAGASRLLEAHALEAVRARHASPLHLARLTSLQGGGAGAWLTSVPYADPLRIPEALWQAASSSRLGLPIPQLALAGQCSCGQAIDDMTVPHHAVRCPRYGVATTIHDTVKYMLRDFAVEAGFAVKVEDSTLFTQLEAARARLLGQPVVGEGTRAEGPGERRGEAGQPGGGGQWGRHQLRGQVERGTGGQRGRQGEQTGQDGEGGRHRQQQESQWRPRAQGAAPPGSASGAGQGREQQRADGGTGGAAGLGGEAQGVREAAGDGAGGSGGLGEGREGEGRGQVDGGEEKGERDDRRGGTKGPDRAAASATAGTSRTHRPSDPQREGNVQLRRATPTQIGVAAARRVQEKLRHWGPHLEGLQPAPHFYACVAETFGLLTCGAAVREGPTTGGCPHQSNWSHPLPPHAIRSPRPYPPRARSLAASFDPPCPPSPFPTARHSLLPARALPSFTFSSPLPSSAARLFLPLADPLHSLPLLNPHPAPRISPPYAWFLPSLPLAAFLRPPPPPSPCPPTLPPLPLASYLLAPPFPPLCAQLLPSLPLPPPRPAPRFPPPPRPVSPTPAPPFLSPCLSSAPSLPPPAHAPVFGFSPPCPTFLPSLPTPSAPPLFSPHPFLLPSLPLISRTPALVSYHPCPSSPPLCTFSLFPPCPSLPPPLPFALPSLRSLLHIPAALLPPSAHPHHQPPSHPSLPPSLSLSLFLTHTHAHSPPPPPHPHPPILPLPAPFPPPRTPLTSHLRATGFPPMVPPLHRSPLCSPSARPFSVPSAGPAPARCCPSPCPLNSPAPRTPQSHPTAPTLPRLPVSALHPRDRVRLPTAQRWCARGVFFARASLPGAPYPAGSLFGTGGAAGLGGEGQGVREAAGDGAGGSGADPQREGNVQLRRATPTQIGVAAARRVQEKLRHWGPHLEGLQPAPHFYRSHPLPPHAIRSPRPYPPRARSLAASFDPPCPARRFPPPAIRSSPPVRSPRLPSPPPSPPLLHASSFPSPTHSTPCPSSIRTLPLVSRPPMLGFSPPCPSPPFSAPHLPPLPAPPLSPPCPWLPTSLPHLSPLCVLSFSPPCPSLLPALPLVFRPPHARFLPSPRLPFFLRASPLLPPCPRLPMPLSLASPLPAPRFFPPYPPPRPLPCFPPHPLLLPSLPLISRTPALVSYHPCPSFPPLCTFSLFPPCPSLPPPLPFALPSLRSLLPIPAALLPPSAHPHHQPPLPSFSPPSLSLSLSFSHTHTHTPLPHPPTHILPFCPSLPLSHPLARPSPPTSVQLPLPVAAPPLCPLNSPAPPYTPVPSNRPPPSPGCPFPLSTPCDRVRLPTAQRWCARGSHPLPPHAIRSPRPYPPRARSLAASFDPPCPPRRFPPPAIRSSPPVRSPRLPSPPPSPPLLHASSFPSPTHSTPCPSSIRTLPLVSRPPMLGFSPPCPSPPFSAPHLPPLPAPPTLPPLPLASYLPAHLSPLCVLSFSPPCPSLLPALPLVFRPPTPGFSPPRASLSFSVPLLCSLPAPACPCPCLWLLPSLPHVSSLPAHPLCPSLVFPSPIASPLPALDFPHPCPCFLPSMPLVSPPFWPSPCPLLPLPLPPQLPCPPYTPVPSNRPHPPPAARFRSPPPRPCAASNRPTVHYRPFPLIPHHAPKQAFLPPASRLLPLVPPRSARASPLPTSYHLPLLPIITRMFPHSPVHNVPPPPPLLPSPLPLCPPHLYEPYFPLQPPFPPQLLPHPAWAAPLHPALPGPSVTQLPPPGTTPPFPPPSNLYTPCPCSLRNPATYPSLPLPLPNSTPPFLPPAKVYTPCFCSLGCAVPNLPPPFRGTRPPLPPPANLCTPCSCPLCPPTPYLNPPQSPPSPTPSIFPPPWGSPIRSYHPSSFPQFPLSPVSRPRILFCIYHSASFRCPLCPPTFSPPASQPSHYPLPGSRQLDYPLPFAPSSLFPTLPFPLGSTCPPPPPVEFCPALPTSGPPPVPTPCSPIATSPPPPHLHYSPPTLPLSIGPQPAPPLGPNPLQLSGPLYPLFHPLRTAFPTLFPFPQANPPAPRPLPGKAGEGRARGELAADTAREGVSEFVCEGAAEAAEDGAAKAAREGAMGVVGEGAAEAAEERAAEAAREGAAAAARERAAGAAREGAAGTTAAVEAARTAAGATEATVGAGIGGGATGAAGKGVTGTGARESAAPAVAREGTAGARVGEGTAVASKAEGEAAAEAAGRAIARPVGAAGAAANAGKHTAGPAGPARTAKGASSKAAAGGVGSGDIGATGEGEVSVVPTGVGTEEGDVIAIEEDEGEDVMHIDGPLAQYLTLDGEADPAPLQPHVEVPVVSRGAAKALAFLAEPCSPTPTLLHGQPPSPSPTPDPTVAGGPPGEHAAHLCPHPQGLLRAPRGAARALVFLEEPCSPTPTNTQPPPAGPLPPPPPGPPPTRRRTAPTRPPNRLPSPHHPPQAAETHPQGLAPQAHGSGGTRVEGPTGEATTGPTQISLPPPFVPRSNLHTGPAPRPPPPTPSPGRVPHEWPRWAAITPHTQLARSVPTEGDVSRREGMHTEHPPPGEPPILPPPTPLAPQPPFPSQTGADNQVAAAAIATGREAVGLRDAPMADATDSPSHPSHPFHVDDPLPQPMVIGEGQGGLLGQGPHPSSAQPARPTPPSTLPALLLSPTGRQVFETPEEVRAGISDLLAIHRLSSSPAAPTLPVPQDRTRTYAEVTRSVPSFIPPATQLGASLPTPMETDRVLRPCHSHLDGVTPPPVQPVAQEVTSSRDEASAPTETPPPGVAEPSLEPHPAEGQEHTTAHTSGSPPRPPSPASTPVPARGPALSCDPLGAPAAHGVPSTASSDATAPIDPADTATSPDQVVSCPTCRSSLANRRALQHHIPFCHPADAARRAQAAHDTASIIPSLSQPRATGMQFTDAQWQTLDSVDWTEYFSPERIHTRPLRRVPERVRGGYLDVLSAILVRIAQDPEAAGPTFLLAAAPTLFLVPATPPDRSHTAAIAARISRFGRGEWAELVSDALGRRTPLPRRTGYRSRTATDPSTADERRIARCLRLAACNETSRACAALESAEAAPDTQGTIQRLQSKHPNAERPTPAWLSGFQGSPLVLSVDHLRRAIFTAPRGSSGGPSGWVAEHLRDTFLAFPHSLHFLLAVYQQWLRGRCAPAARSLLASSTLVALAKSNMDVRPIAIGEVLVRILSRAVCLQLRDQMARVFLASQQFGVGVMCGTEVVVRGVRRALADHPDWVVLQLDVANAFNSFHRDRMFQALQASPEFQCLIPFIGLFYGTPSDLHYRSGTGVVTMHSERGTRQGDPLSPFLYALTQRLALEPVLAEGDVQLWSYADDTYVLGSRQLDYPLPFAPSSLFPTLPSPLGSTCPPPPPVEFCPALPTSGPPPVPHPAHPPLHHPALPPPLQPANTSPLNQPPARPPPWAPIPSNCQAPSILSSTHCAPLSPPFSPFPKLTPRTPASAREFLPPLTPS